jgi:hypothetical protein
LSDLHKLNFGGPISDSINKAKGIIGKASFGLGDLVVSGLTVPTSNIGTSNLLAGAGATNNTTNNGGITILVQGNTIKDKQDIDTLTNEIIKKLKYAGVY